MHTQMCAESQGNAKLVENAAVRGDGAKPCAFQVAVVAKVVKKAARACKVTL